MREKNLKHAQLEILNRRTVLGTTDKKDLLKYQLGYTGELQFDAIIESLALPVIHLKDYRFHAGTAGDKKVDAGPAEIQIDNIIIAEDQLFTFEIKNYQYDLEYNTDRPWKFAGGREIVSPLNQVENHRNVLASMMRDFNMQLNMSNNLVFIHLEQTIYNLPNHPNIFVRSNLNKRLRMMLKPNRYDHAGFVEQLDARRLEKSAYDTDANVTFEELSGGLFCPDCENSRLRRVHRDKFECPGCNSSLIQHEVLNQLITELHILNADWKLTSDMLAKYSGDTFSGSSIRRYRLKGLIEF